MYQGTRGSRLAPAAARRGRSASPSSPDTPMASAAESKDARRWAGRLASNADQPASPQAWRTLRSVKASPCALHAVPLREGRAGRTPDLDPAPLPNTQPLGI